MHRASGILLPITSLPSRYGIGCFSKSAYEFADWLKSAKQSYWQILPLGNIGFGNSPYQSFSTFAGNPYMISLEALTECGLLNKTECDGCDFGNNPSKVDYGALYKNRYSILKKAFLRFSKENNEYCDFKERNKDWLYDYSLFMSLKQHFNGRSYSQWEDSYLYRDTSSLRDFAEKNSIEMEFHCFLQYEFFNEWFKLKKYVNSLGIKIIGDMPIYVAHDSADVWSNPELFFLDENKMPKFVAGCPPDGFSPIGQVWGNPLYDWNYHKITEYKWWRKRMEFALKLYDVVRIDHFRGFDEYYAIAYGEKTAINGQWEKGPGMKLFDSFSDIANGDNIIAEDLGFMTDSVKKLLEQTGFAGMKIIEFAFDKRDSSSNDHLPHNYNKNSVVYTGTHDNQTLLSWFYSISEKERKNATEYLCSELSDKEKICNAFISLAMRSVSKVCIIPMQDWLMLDDESRMNTPSTLEGNWQWRMKEIPESRLCKKISHMTKLFNR